MNAGFFESGPVSYILHVMSSNKGFLSKLKYSVVFSIRMQIYDAANIQILLFSNAHFSHFKFSINPLMFLPIEVALLHVPVYKLKA